MRADSPPSGVMRGSLVSISISRWPRPRANSRSMVSVSISLLALPSSKARTTSGSPDQGQKVVVLVGVAVDSPAVVEAALLGLHVRGGEAATDTAWPAADAHVELLVVGCLALGGFEPALALGRVDGPGDVVRLVVDDDVVGRPVLSGVADEDVVDPHRVAPGHARRQVEGFLRRHSSTTRPSNSVACMSITRWLPEPVQGPAPLESATT